ncbi:putative aarF domain-containing protein kinase 1 [Balamuthia mandrillaris]
MLLCASGRRGACPSSFSSSPFSGCFSSSSKPALPLVHRLSFRPAHLVPFSSRPFAAATSSSSSLFRAPRSSLLSSSSPSPSLLLLRAASKSRPFFFTAAPKRREISSSPASYGSGSSALSMRQGFLAGLACASLLAYWTLEEVYGPIDHALDRARRFSVAAKTAVLVAYDYKSSLRGVTGEERKRVIKEVHQRSAERLLASFRKLGGIYIKAGQHISCLEYILPTEYTSTMSPLHDQAPTESFDNVVRVFKEEFVGSHPDELFALFEREPIAAASLAQVHRAVRYDGEEVAVKVQFHGLHQRAWGDVRTIALLIDGVAWLFPEFEFKWLVTEFNNNLPKELDFVNEGRNGERLAHNFKDYPHVGVPKVHWDLTTKRVLTMEYIHGKKLDDMKGLEELGVSVKKAATLLATVFSKQIFVDGLVHCDPHPGNLLVRRADRKLCKSGAWDVNAEPELVVLDHGLYRELNDEFRLNYCHLWLSLIEMDEAKIKHYSQVLCGPKADYQLFSAMLTARAWDAVKAGLKNNKHMDSNEKQAILIGAQQRLVEIADILRTVPSDLLLLFKTNDLLRLLNRQLGSPINTFTITADYCMRGIQEDSLRKDPSLKNLLRVKAERFAWTCKVRLMDYALWFSSFFSSQK